MLNFKKNRELAAKCSDLEAILLIINLSNYNLL